MTLFVIGFIVAIAAISFYFFHFAVTVGLELSNQTEDWAHFGAYIGGVVGSALSFVSIILLIRTLDLQRETNIKLDKEISEEKVHKKLKLFEAQFFHMIEVQRQAINNLEICFEVDSGSGSYVVKSYDAILELEDVIYSLKDAGYSFDKIKKVVNECDRKDSGFSLLRIFSLMQKMISNDLSDSNGFSRDVRKKFYLSLINFTDFAQLRMVLLLMKYSDQSMARGIRGNRELAEVFQETKLDKYINDI